MLSTINVILAHCKSSLPQTVDQKKTLIFLWLCCTLLLYGTHCRLNKFGLIPFSISIPGATSKSINLSPVRRKTQRSAMYKGCLPCDYTKRYKLKPFAD